MSNIHYVQVAPCIPLQFGGKEFYTYHIDQDQVVPEGALVRIPFGKRSIQGVIVKIDIKKPRYPTKPIRTITRTVLTKEQMKFAHWIAKYAHGGLGYTLRLFAI